MENFTFTTPEVRLGAPDFSDRYKYNPYVLALALKYAMRTLAERGDVDPARLHELAEAAAEIIDQTFAAEFGPQALQNPNPWPHFRELGI